MSSFALVPFHYKAIQGNNKKLFFAIANDAVSILKQRGICQEMDATVDLVNSDVMDHYRTYCLIEKMLIEPSKLQEQSSFQIDIETTDLLIER